MNFRFDDNVADDDEEEERDAVEEPHVDHLDVGSDGERVGAVIEERVQHQQRRQAQSQSIL